MPVYYSAPLAYAKLVPGAPIGLDGKVVDTPEVSYAKAEHAAAHIKEKVNLANEAVRSADSAPLTSAPVVATAYSAAVAPAVVTKYVAGAPIGLDGRVVDTPEVALAKAEHSAAHINEKIEHSNEALKTADYISYAAAPVAIASPFVATSYSSGFVAPLPLKYTAGGAPIGIDGRVVDTPEVSLAKAEHAAAHINEKIDQGLLRNSFYSSPFFVSSPAYATAYLHHY